MAASFLSTISSKIPKPCHAFNFLYAYRFQIYICNFNFFPKLYTGSTTNFLIASNYIIRPAGNLNIK